MAVLANCEYSISGIGRFSLGGERFESSWVRGCNAILPKVPKIWTFIGPHEALNPGVYLWGMVLQSLIETLKDALSQGVACYKMPLSA